MNPFMKGVFRFLQALAIISLNIYYRKIVYINRSNLRAKGPLMNVSNHANTGLDPLFSLMYSRETCNVLANYSLFKNPISNAILSTLFYILEYAFPHNSFLRVQHRCNLRLANVRRKP